jgi:Electron transfer DM13
VRLSAKQEDLVADIDDHAPPRRTVRRRRWPWLAVVLAIAVAAFVLVWFQPQKLFIDERINDAAPTVAGAADPADPSTATASTTPPSPSPATPPVPALVARGEFLSRDHGTSGLVLVLDVGGGAVVRLEDLDTDNGPDLYLYLSTNRAAGDEDVFDDEVVNLGRLKGNLGDQNYDVPAGTDLSRYRSVVIWCDRFNSAFGAADLVGS